MSLKTGHLTIDFDNYNVNMSAVTVLMMIFILKETISLIYEEQTIVYRQMTINNSKAQKPKKKGMSRPS